MWKLRSVLDLKCDVCGDRRQLFGHVDFAVRDEARHLGWTRRPDGRHPTVLCPVCAKKEDSREH